MKITHNLFTGICSAIIGMAAVSACSGSNEWKVDGNIEGADGQTMLLEASSNGRWYSIDSVKLKGSGQFAMSHPAAGYPDIYRLRLGDKTLYFPIDSIETVTVVTKADAFDREYTLAGSPAAEMLMNVDRRLMDVASRNGIGSIATDSLLKRELGGMLLGDPAGIVSYYIINKKIGGVSVFNPNDKRDLRIIGAVANAFNQNRPNDPRTAYLKNLFLSKRAASSATPLDTIMAQEVPLFEIELFDNTGQSRSLRETASKGDVVLLSFTAYTSDISPAYNVELNKVYERFHNQGLEIYQVALDADEYQWRQSAKNLPWITVYNSSADGSANLLNYNVVSLPATFLIDRNGELRERITNPTEIASVVARYM